ncbi:MAG: hypothetical protein ABI789_09920 [Usitatibacter sp.]
MALAAPTAFALALGEPQVRSALGENLDVRIPVTIGKGESIEPSCFMLSGEPASAMPRLTTARLSLERSAQGTYLRIRTAISVSEPALVVGIIAACRGVAEYRREYTLLLDLSAGEAARLEGASARAPKSEPAGPAANLSSAVATLIAHIGDTLESIANAIFPRNRVAKKSYIEALRKSNPSLAPLGDNDPIPVDTPIALPDLRTFSHARAAHEAPTARATARVPRALIETQPAAPRAAPDSAAAPAPRASAQTPRAARPARAPRSSPAPTAPEANAPAREESAAPNPARARAEQRGPGFALKLSSPEVDLSRSRSIDERMRSQLRDRQLVLDVDDQVAAVLALRNSVRVLESKVSELQLKLAGMPSSFPAPKATEESKPAPTPQPPDAAPAPAVTPAPEAKLAEPAPSVVAAPAPETKTAPRPATKTAAPAPEIDWLYYGMWLLALLLVIAAIALAWRLARRRREDSVYDEDAASNDAMAEDEEDRIVVADEFSEEPVLAQEPAIVEAPRREIDSDVDLPTRFPDNNTDDLRRRYIEERFPEIGKGAIVLADATSVVKGARLFYEDGALARTVELLHYAIERNPAEVRNWLALFEVFRLERLPGEFAELARRFREQHGKSEYWRKVQYFGREIDPDNELYAQAPVNTFETIGPSEARRLAAEAVIDPVAENWLGMPMDFQNEVLANELRKMLMSGAGLNEQDLVPNPMPALRNIEMFSLA